MYGSVHVGIDYFSEIMALATNPVQVQEFKCWYFSS